MKYFSKITLGLILCAGFVSSCKDDDEVGIDGITIDKEEITIGAEGGTEKIAVSSNDQWVARVSQPWIAVSPANGLGSAVCDLAIDSTLTNVARTAQVRFTMDGREPRLVTVTQFGFGKQILVREPEVKIPSSDVYKDRHFESTISTNVNFKIGSVDYSFAEEATMTDEEKKEVEGERSNWVTLPKDKDLEVNLDRGARPRTLKVDFRWGMNVAPYTRVAKIHLIPVNPNQTFHSLVLFPTVLKVYIHCLLSFLRCKRWCHVRLLSRRISLLPSLPGIRCRMCHRIHLLLQPRIFSVA